MDHYDYTFKVSTSNYDDFSIPKQDNIPEYRELYNVLIEAYNQAARGKGKERHAQESQKFVDQPILQITRRYGIGFPLGQAEKKMEEAQRLDYEQKIKELLGAINYIAAAIIYIRESEGVKNHIWECDKKDARRDCELCEDSS